ncbi:monovalent cation/H+ antiporter complex subunit F [Ancylobacter pratisalsi]|uniref:monovalent cation/H+ antiporter complex subunit F n=1 Tax=Ancylobacter pratisalsi TaxID=1745854 RepID=UPI001FE8F938|nr:monovalent cation/H+ antiporter complex subunit F [Ancylobacter pratisalsi]
MFLVAVGAFILLMIGLGLVRLLRGPSAADRMMAAQLAGTGLAAVCLLLASASGMSAIADVAVALALLAALGAVALSRHAGPAREPGE